MAPLQRNPSLSKTKVIQHPTHPKHPLHLQEFSDSTEFSCDGCSVIGSGTRYHCATCEFDLHDFCATCPSTLSSHLHPSHPLQLQNKVVDNRVCDLCGDLVNGLFYSCEECKVDIHPLCTLLPPTAKHSLHPQHILKLQPEKSSWCVVCRQLCNLWRYRCNTCCLDIHVECVLDDCSSDSTCRAFVVQPSQAQPPPISSDAFVTESTSRAQVKQTSQAQPPPRPGLSIVPSGLTTRGMVAQPVQPSPGYNIGVPFGGLPMQMNQGFYMNMIQPMMYQGQEGNQVMYGNKLQGGNQVVFANQGQGGNQVVFANQGQGGNQVVFANQGQGENQVVFANQGQGGNQVVFANQGQGGNQVMYGNQLQGGNQVVFANQFQGGNQGMFGMHGMNYQHIICHQGQGMDQPGSSNNNNNDQGGDGKPKMGVKKKMYRVVKIAANVASLATTGVPLGL